jgi:Txe/YoeB family toxin of Txe-Axe toxin-antitoxin module
MEIEIVWSLHVEMGLSKTLNYLETEWITKEILQLEKNIIKFIIRIKPYPEIEKIKGLYKGRVDQNNYIVYKINRRKKQILFVNFRNSKPKTIN